MNLYDSTNAVLKRLDDYPAGGETVWTRAEIELYLHDGYNAFCRATKCILDFFYPENVPQAGNYVAPWEKGYFQSGMVAVGLLGFSGGYWEQDYAEPGSTGPANHTQPWETQSVVGAGSSSVTWQNILAVRGRSVDEASGDCVLEGTANEVVWAGLTSSDSLYGDFTFVLLSAGGGDYQVTFYYQTTNLYTSPLSTSLTPKLVVSGGVVYAYVNDVLVHTYAQAPAFPLWVHGVDMWHWDTASLTFTYSAPGYSYDQTIFPVSMHPVPEDNVAVDRATHDFGTLDPEFSRWLEQNDRSFQTTAGTPSRFSMDRDGMSRLRIVPAGDGQATTPTVSGTFGLLRSVADTDGCGTWAPIGSWGVLREIPEHFPMGAQYGIPRRLYSDESNTRVEYFRLGKDLDELPDRFAKYVQFYAQAKALERDGPGQDAALAQHFMGRYQDGVRRMVLRLSENKRSRLSAIGSAGKRPTKPGLARLPYRYGHATRRGY